MSAIKRLIASLLPRHAPAAGHRVPAADYRADPPMASASVAPGPDRRWPAAFAGAASGFALADAVDAAVAAESPEDVGYPGERWVGEAVETADERQADDCQGGSHSIGSGCDTKDDHGSCRSSNCRVRN